jgi:oxygen-independent coproporphyrinogen-3 oxidase
LTVGGPVRELIFDEDLIRKYNLSGPRYTSYPTVLQFAESFGCADYSMAAGESNAEGRPLSLYFHLPFCATLCYYCACNKIATRKRHLADEYLDYLIREIELQSELYQSGRPVTQLHWGGGTPTFLSDAQMTRLMEATGSHFELANDGEFSIEVDPREVREETVATLRDLGFNRMSVGVQDFEPAVQKAVNRVQSEATTRRVIDEARAQGFRSMSIDLIYGLPFQTVDTFARTLQRIIDISPDRLSIYNYAHMPHLFPAQGRLDPNDMPDPQEKLRILELAINELTSAGYAYVGMDHFAKTTDELFTAQESETLHRNFQGYSTHRDTDLIGLGVTAIGNVGETFYQNFKTLDEYYQRIDTGDLAVAKGLRANADDALRRAVITELICYFRLDFATFQVRHGVRFADRFADELTRLRPLADDGLIELNPDGIRVTEVGRLLVRHVCMAFDAYAKQATLDTPRYSRII